jgi:hypothetical protein
MVVAIAIAGIAMTAALWGLRGRDPSPLPDATRTIELPRQASPDAPSTAPPPAEDVAPIGLPKDAPAPPDPSGEKKAGPPSPNPRTTQTVHQGTAPRPGWRRSHDPSATF